MNEFKKGLRELLWVWFITCCVVGGIVVFGLPLWIFIYVLARMAG